MQILNYELKNVWYASHNSHRLILKRRVAKYAQKNFSKKLKFIIINIH